MNSLFCCTALILLSIVSTPTLAQHHAAEQPTKKSLSPRMSTTATLSGTVITIDYSSPSVRGRTIWGGLVTMGQVWVAGAHRATNITFSQDIRFGQKAIKAGKYGLFMIPGASVWTVILNQNHDQHLADDYDPKLDIVRVDIPAAKQTMLQESLIYEFQPVSARESLLVFRWEHIAVAVKLQMP